MKTPTTSLQRLQSATSRADLAALLNIKHADLTYILYKQKDSDKYKRFTIKKRSGGSREINAPQQNLKSLQRRLTDVFTDCLNERDLAVGIKNSAAHGFLPGKSILTNASAHRNKRYVLNLDLKDFFPSISGKRIRGLLINDRHFKFTPQVATTIAHIASCNGVLPQGSPSSPVLSNLVAGILDVHLVRLAKLHGCKYTRYADDITFSTNKKEFPKEIALQEGTTDHTWILGSRLLKIIKSAGFFVNPEKTRMQYKTSRQMVTGLVVNKRVNVPIDYRRLVRAYVHSLITKGSYRVKTVTKNSTGIIEEKYEFGTIPQLQGMLGFIHSVDDVFRAELRSNPYNYAIRSAKTDNANSNLLIFRRFLVYTKFYANDLPFLVCEGKTDGVHLSCAAHALRAIFPRLTRKKDDGKSVLAFRLLKYARQHKKQKNIYLPNSSSASILGIGSGGGPNLANLLDICTKEYPRFKAPQGEHPVIFIVDNDSGAKPIKNKIKEKFKITVDSSQPFTHIFGNIYLVLITCTGKSEPSIEDLFSPSDVIKGLNGKPFDFTKDADPKITAGKEQFAYQFVAKNSDTLDWSGFKPLLKNICHALEDFDARKAAAA